MAPQPETHSFLSWGTSVSDHEGHCSLLPPIDRQQGKTHGYLGEGREEEAGRFPRLGVRVKV